MELGRCMDMKRFCKMMKISYRDPYKIPDIPDNVVHKLYIFYLIWSFHKVFWKQKIIAGFQRKTINVEQEKKAECIDYCSRPVRLKTQTCKSEPFPAFITTPVTTR